MSCEIVQASHSCCASLYATVIARKLEMAVGRPKRLRSTHTMSQALLNKGAIMSRFSSSEWLGTMVGRMVSI